MHRNSGIQKKNNSWIFDKINANRNMWYDLIRQIFELLRETWLWLPPKEIIDGFRNCCWYGDIFSSSIFVWLANQRLSWLCFVQRNSRNKVRKNEGDIRGNLVCKILRRWWRKWGLRGRRRNLRKVIIILNMMRSFLNQSRISQITKIIFLSHFQYMK